METFIASRLTSGNKIFPAQIILSETTVTLKDPGLFNGTEKTIPYTRISSVNIEVPLIGFSTIVIDTTGEDSITMHGFTEEEVNTMKEKILSKINA